MKNRILFFIFSFSTFLSFSQYIEGKVLDAETNEPIEGVHVYMKGINKGTLTNERGNYYLKFPYKIVKNDIISLSHIAYKEVEIPYSSKKKEYLIYLIRDVKKLSEIELYQNRKLKSSLSYKRLASMKSGIHSFGAFLKNEKIYVIGGDSSFEENSYLKYLTETPDPSFGEMLEKARPNFSKQRYKGDLLIYNINANTWRIEKEKFSKRAYHNVNYYENNIYVLGGKRISKNKKIEYLVDEIEVFDFKSNSIKIDNTNPHQAVDFASFIYKDKIIVMGGSIKKSRNGFKEYSNKVHLYNLKTGYWYQLGSMPIAKEVRGILIEDKIYLLGGFNKKPFSGIETFNLVTQKWEKEGELFRGISKPGITHKNDIIYFYNEGRIGTYNIKTKQLKEYFIDLNLESPELFYANNKLYILGGFKLTNYSINPSRGLFSIDLHEFEKTKVQNSKTL
ncbi:MAG: galactose oxidase [Lutibacter sp.]|nr:MAG: galactose oxidase [Lutibacter sp.]